MKRTILSLSLITTTAIAGISFATTADETATTTVSTTPATTTISNPNPYSGCDPKPECYDTDPSFYEGTHLFGLQIEDEENQDSDK